MKHFVGISLFLLALPMVAAEAPMSYVRFTTPDPLALSYPSLSPLRLLRKQPGMQRGLEWKENTFCKRSALRFQTAIPYSDKNSKRT